MNLKVLPIKPIKKSEVALFLSLKIEKKINFSDRAFFEKLSINL